MPVFPESHRQLGVGVGYSLIPHSCLGDSVETLFLLTPCSSSPGFLLPLLVWRCNLGSLSLTSGSSRGHPRNPLLHNPWPLALSNLKWVQMGSLPESYSTSLVIREPTLRPVGQGLRTLPRPAPYTSCAFQFPLPSPKMTLWERSV